MKAEPVGSGAALRAMAGSGPPGRESEREERRLQPPASTAPAPNAGVIDLSQLMAAIAMTNGQAVRPSATPPAKFAGQPMSLRPPSSVHVSVSSGSGGSVTVDGGKRVSIVTYTSWIDDMERYFAMCSMKDEGLQFVYGLNQLTGTALLHMQRLVKKGGNSLSGAAPATWAWLKDKLKEISQPDTQKDALKLQLSLLTQGRMSINEYYTDFQWYMAMLELPPREQFDYFFRGLREEYRTVVREQQATLRTALTALRSVMSVPADVDVGTLTVEASAELCLAKEMEWAQKAEIRRMQQPSGSTGHSPHYSGHRYGNGYTRGGSANNRGGAAASRPYYGVGNTRSQPILLSNLESHLGSSSRDEVEGQTMGEGGYEVEGYAPEGDGPGYELNAVGVTPSTMVRAYPPRDASAGPRPFNNNNNGRGVGGEMRCWNCDQAGHRKRECRQPLRARGGYGGGGANSSGRADGGGGADKNSRGEGKV